MLLQFCASRTKSWQHLHITSLKRQPAAQQRKQDHADGPYIQGRSRVRGSPKNLVSFVEHILFAGDTTSESVAFCYTMALSYDGILKSYVALIGLNRRASTIRTGPLSNLIGRRVAYARYEFSRYLRRTTTAMLSVEHSYMQPCIVIGRFFFAHPPTERLPRHTQASGSNTRATIV